MQLDVGEDLPYVGCNCPAGKPYVGMDLHLRSQHVGMGLHQYNWTYTNTKRKPCVIKDLHSIVGKDLHYVGNGLGSDTLAYMIGPTGFTLTTLSCKHNITLCKHKLTLHCGNRLTPCRYGLTLSYISIHMNTLNHISIQEHTSYIISPLYTLTYIKPHDASLYRMIQHICFIVLRKASLMKLNDKLSE